MGPNVRTICVALLACLSASASFADAGWKVSKDKAGGYCVSFPVTPTEFKKPCKSGSFSMVLHGLVTEWKGGVLMSAFADLPDVEIPKDSEQTVLDFSVNSVAREAGTDVTENVKFDYDGHAARKIVATKAGKTLEMYLILGNRRLYEIMAVHGSSGNDAGYKKFFDSFSLAK